MVNGHTINFSRSSHGELRKAQVCSVADSVTGPCSCSHECCQPGASCRCLQVRLLVLPTDCSYISVFPSWQYTGGGLRVLWRGDSLPSAGFSILPAPGHRGRALQRRGVPASPVWRTAGLSNSSDRLVFPTQEHPDPCCFVPGGSPGL